MGDLEFELNDSDLDTIVSSDDENQDSSIEITDITHTNFDEVIDGPEKRCHPSEIDFELSKIILLNYSDDDIQILTSESGSDTNKWLNSTVIIG